MKCYQSWIKDQINRKNERIEKWGGRMLTNRLLIRKINLKAHNSRNMLLHVKEVEAPHSFTAANIACI